MRHVFKGGAMRKFFKWIWEKWLARRNKKLEEIERKIRAHEDLKRLKKLQDKKKELGKLRSDESHK